MKRHLQCRHRIVVDLPVDRAFMLFTPAGEERWVDGWAPTSTVRHTVRATCAARQRRA
jgi:hypothetical protein